MIYKNTILKFLPLLSFVIILFTTNYVYADDDKTPTLILPDDIYSSSNIPVHVNFEVTAFDYKKTPIKVECSQISGHVFQLGKTTVRCLAIDSNGIESRDSFVVTVGYDIVQIPSWVKNQTGWWIDGKISDKEFLKNIEFLLDKKIIHIPLSHITKENTDMTIPSWIKLNSEKWSHDEISDDEFSIGIQWLTEKGVIWSEPIKTTR